MKEYLKEFVIFIFILTGILWSFEFLLKTGVRNSNNDQTGKVNRIFNHEIKSDVVIFGPSVAEVGINANVLARTLNRSVYNAAIDGTAFPQYKCLVDEIADYSEETKYVIFGITYFDFLRMDQLTEPSRFYAHLNNPYVYESFKKIDNDKITKVRYVPFYSITQYSHLFYKNAAIGWMNYFKDDVQRDTLNGFVPHDRKFVNTITAKDSVKTFLSLDTAQVNSFMELKEKLRKRNIKVIVIFMPMHKPGQRLFVNLKEVVGTIKTWVDPGYFMDYTTSSMCNDEDNFYNNNHLNTKGAALLSEDIGRQLLDREIIK